MRVPLESGTPTYLLIEIIQLHVRRPEVVPNNVESTRQFAVYLARRYFAHNPIESILRCSIAQLRNGNESLASGPNNTYPSIAVNVGA